jgi:hypothetical protein
MKCINCKNKEPIPLFTLKNISMTGKFYNKNKKLKKSNLNLVMCKKCKLVQLTNRFDLKYLFNQDYGYSSSLNKSMAKHLKEVVDSAMKYALIDEKDIVLDIASNDGTLLNFYPPKLNLIKVGIDPILNKFKKNYKKIDHAASTFFSSKEYFKLTKRKAKIITALSVFYDSPNPNKFLNDIKLTLHENGIFILEQSDLALMLKNMSIDTICHEHISYYSIKILNSMMLKNKLKIFRHEYNDINGGSSRFYITHSENKQYKISLNFKQKINNEKNFFLENKKTYFNFYNQVEKNKNTLLKLLKKLKLENKTIHGFGASTKGNTILQHFQLDSKYLDFIAEINPDKYNKFTPGTNIKIISEKKSLSMKPNYYLVLPWHFKKNILNRFKKSKTFKGIFLFPFPKVSLINMKKYYE